MSGHRCSSSLACLRRARRARSMPSVGDSGIGGIAGNGLKPSLSWLTGNVVGILPVAARERARGRGHRRRDAELAGAAGLARAVGGMMMTSISRRRVPLARVVGVVPAALQEAAVLQVQAVGEAPGRCRRSSPPIIFALMPSGLIGSPTSTTQVTRVTRGPAMPPATLRLTVCWPRVDLHHAGDEALVLAVHADALRDARRQLAPT